MKIFSDLHKKGFFDLLSVNFLTQALGFGSLLLVAKFLTPNEFGQIKLIQSYASVFILIAGFGFNTAVLKLCSEKRQQAEKEGILKRSTLNTLVATLLALALLGFLVLTDVITSSKEIGFWLLVYSIGIPFAAITGLFTTYLQALKKIKEMARAQALVRVQSVSLIVVSTWLWGFEGFILSTILAYIVGLYPILKQVGFGFVRADASNLLPSNYMHIASFSFTANILAAIGMSTDVFILDHFSTDRSTIGYFSLATIFVLGAMQVTGTVQAIATPYFSERGFDESWVRQKILETQFKMAGLSVVIALLIYFLAWLTISYYYGESYVIVLSYLSILLLKYVIYSSCAVIGVALVGLGLMRYNLMVVAISTPIGFFFSYTLFLQHGALGVAWAQVWSAVLLFVLVIIISRIALRAHFSKLIDAKL
ncbi:MAG: oligosaccharide flippase family protein [Opitutaceae bacterium]|nr:oligosaccharide flippase family protein [Opitutaceae bacterium]